MKKKKKTEGKGKQLFPFLLTRNKRQEPQLLIKVYCQKQIATMTREQNQQMEAAILRCVSKYVFLEISQYPYEKHKSICVRVSLE